MQIKTQYLGRDVREKMRELVLEEHESCECRCLVVTASQCMRPGTCGSPTLPITLEFLDFHLTGAKKVLEIEIHPQS